MIHKGNHVVGQTYEPDDVVSYDHKSFRALKRTQYLPITGDWECLAVERETDDVPPASWTERDLRLAKLLGDTVRPVFEEMRKEIDHLRTELAEVKQREFNFADIHKGIWKGDAPYKRGSVVTDHGGVWLAMEHTDGRPGSTDSWKLIAKGVQR